MIQFIVEATAFQLVFLLGYDLFLRQETFFQWNRLYLLGTFIASLVLPWIKIEAFKSAVKTDSISYPQFFLNLDVTTGSVAPDQLSFWNNLSLLEWMYLCAAFVMLVWFLAKLYRISSLKGSGLKSYYPEFTKVVVHKSAVAFSFFRIVFLGDDIPKTKEPQIIAHELVHIKQWHSLDLLFFELMRIVFWFNPLVYVYQNRLAELHEFLADAINKKEQYQLLLAEAFQTQHISFINQFFKPSLIKKRIVMLSKAKSKKLYRFKYLLLVPLILAIVLYTSCEMEHKKESELTNTPLTVGVGEKKVSFMEVDKAPIFPGCENEANAKACFQEKMVSHIKEHFNYPQEAQEQGIQGRVSIVFVIGSDGVIKNIRKRGPHELLENEAVKIVQRLPQMVPGMQNGQPVEVPFSIPITFKLRDETATMDHEIQKFSERKAGWVPFSSIDSAPIFPGCENEANTKVCFQEKMVAHIKKHFNYPQGARDQGIQGRVAIVFVIDEKGLIKNIRKRGPHELLENEAVRIIESLPQMEPGRNDGQPVKVPFSIPITFRL